MDTPSPKIISYKSDNVILEQTLPWDCDISECFDAFKKILTAMSFSEYQIESYLDEYNSEILEWYADMFNDKKEKSLLI
jgi:hypothetical protein